MRSVRQKSEVSARVRTKFTRKLLAWWARAARDLPWRKTRDPYRVLVSEFMLQQTQVSRVAEYYPRFLESFPDLETLARARPRAVREAWEGLILRPRAESPCVSQTGCRKRRGRKGRYRKRRCRVAGRSSGADQASRYRCLHCGGCRIFCVRKACPRRRYQRREGDGKSISRGQPATPVRQPATPYLVSSSGARSEKRQDGMAI